MKNFYLKALLVTLPILCLMACGVADGGKVTARDVLRNNPEADILMYNGFIYSNVTNLEWFQEEKDQYEKDTHLGDIKKKTSSSFWFKDFFATTVPEGTSIYSNSQDKEGVGIIIVELNGEVLYYMLQLEG